MVNMTLSVPKELKKEMDSHPWVNWSEVARMAFRDKVRDLKVLEDFVSESEITDEDALELGRKVNKALRKRYTEST
jgi:hypothetical protein